MKKYTESDWVYSITDSGEAIILKYTGDDSVVTIPPVLNDLAVEELDRNAFRKAEALEKIVLPASLKRVWGNPFACCENLREIEVVPGNPFFRAVDGVLYDTDDEDPYLVCYPAGKRDRTFEVPAGNGCIGDDAFSCNPYIQEVTICDDVSAILSWAFADCTALRKVVIPNSVRRIRDNAFRYCIALRRVTLPDSVLQLGSYVFGECRALKHVRLSKRLATFALSTFRDCDNLQKLVIPNGVRELTIDNSATPLPDKKREIFVPPSVSTVNNRDRTEGVGYTFYVSWDKMDLWSRQAFDEQNADYHWIYMQTHRFRQSIIDRIRWGWFLLNWKLRHLRATIFSPRRQMGRLKVVPMDDEELGIFD